MDDEDVDKEEQRDEEARDEMEDMEVVMSEREASDILLEAVQITLGKKRKSERVFFKEDDEESDKFLAATGEAIPPLTTKARRNRNMSSIYSKVKSEEKEDPSRNEAL